MKINLLALTPLLRAAVDRYGEEVAEIVTLSDVHAAAYGAREMAALGQTHIVAEDPANEENEFAAERFEEGAVLLLCAAKMLRDGVKK